MLKFPLGSKGARYPQVAFDYALYLCEKGDEHMYNMVAKTYALPSHSHVQKVFRCMFDENVSEDGPCHKMIANRGE
jgi:hypothetical protein